MLSSTLYEARKGNRLLSVCLLFFRGYYYNNNKASNEEYFLFLHNLSYTKISSATLYVQDTSCPHVQLVSGHWSSAEQFTPCSSLSRVILGDYVYHELVSTVCPVSCSLAPATVEQILTVKSLCRCQHQH